ncbi:MAG: prephenate dehydrogenase/arogenate dehydrogenase family protein, partial [Gammaproteobacteria bacterium]
MIDTLVIIGVGLIGGSLARALRRSGAVGEIVGVGRSAANLEAAVDLGVVDRFEFDAAKAVRGADMVVVAVTLGASAESLETIGPALDENTFVTDVGSTKLSVVASARAA